MNTSSTIEHDSAAPAALSVEGLGKRYRPRWRGSVWALRECSFQLPAGRVAALVGQNGAGKTTLMNVLVGALTPTEGRVLVGGEVCDRSRQQTRDAVSRVSMVAQEKPLYRHFSVADMLQVGARLNRVWDQQRATRWLSCFDIPLSRPCGKLSGGQQAQVALAVALAAQPAVLLLDEPLANLDPLARRQVTNELLAEVADTGITVLLSTHVVAELGGVADYMLLLAHGKLLADGDVDELLASHLYYVGPRSPTPPGPGEVLQARHTDHQSTYLVRLRSSGPPPAVTTPWVTRAVTLEELVLAYLEKSGTPVVEEVAA